MFLKKITLDNYGLYRGQVTFNLSPETAPEDQPIVLFGGQNGAGKTTLFDAIRLAFYGKTAIGSRLTDNEYKTFLASKIHRSTSAVLHANYAAISIEFQHVILGERSEYKICRSWESSESEKITEKLSIWKDGETLTGVNQDYWAGFIEEVIPERLSSLFFFDGEKIKSIADDTNGNAAMAESIRTLLGLDIVEKLKSDLAIYRTKQAKQQSNSDYASQINSLELEVEELDANLLALKEELASNKTGIDGIQNTINKVEGKLRNEGSVFANQRDTFIERRAQIETSIEEQSKIIHHQCETMFPFSLCPTLCDKLTKQLAAEDEGTKARVVVNELNGILSEIQSKLSSDANLADKISKGINNRLNKYNAALDFTSLLKLSPKEALTILGWIEHSANSSKPSVNSARDERENLTLQLRKVEQDIQKAPESTVLEPIIEELNSHNQRLGELQQQRVELEEKLRKNENILADAQRRLHKATIAEVSDKACGKRIELTTRIDDALEEYAAKLTQKKIEGLRITVTKCFNRLSRKGNLIKDIQIDPDNFSVTLFDRYGHMLPKEELSAGEKQLFAVALLWGLSITSGRPLPVIIDTPLGRLDNAHRKTLIHNYFPKAAAQVIILSTDTEIDEQWHAELKPYVSKSFMLAHDTVENCTSVKEEYFWS
ncbi:DNA sulfur modification protein DndD [Halodesulfovibrio aestuarii]|uniref:DNA sulfur modification protein DndD n=1 Tax=Halodesulfovibrio aestuarii TaxID=126333 RepID=A0A8G2C7Y9_9BACT|nr:DNA sulfur modification protein DndD [Halodesulfovibrio aestuarii]SHI72725.1 DNA sulfur modification protein DndD [Halodesulfovibrio aestuarii]